MEYSSSSGASRSWALPCGSTKDGALERASPDLSRFHSRHHPSALLECALATAEQVRLASFSPA
jgi:hypothetical protein